jgi:tetratricopeptide (TPR) repeat protein
MLFAAHPLHTEIVANIKGRDEILAFLFSIAALNSIINYIDKNNKLELINAFIFMFLGSMSKEITITFIAVIPLSIYFFRKAPVSKYLVSIIPLIGGALLYMIIRSAVIGEQTAIEATQLMNNPFLGTSLSQRYATVVYTLLIYLKLLVFPHPLTWDYYPFHIPIVAWTDWRVIVSLLVYMSLIVVAIYGLKKRSIYSYAILIYAATLSITSNIFFNIGAFMSERFVYVSLLGICLVVAFLISEKLYGKVNHLKKYRQLGLAILVVILLAFSGKTVSRNLVWENNLTLFEHDVKISVNSAKGNSSYASELYKLAEDAEIVKDTALRNKYLMQSKPYFEKAIEIYPDYSESLIRLGNIYYKMNGDYKTMLKYYIETLKASPLNADVWTNTVGVLEYNVNDPAYEKYVWSQFIKYSPNKWDSYYYMGNLYYFDKTPKADSAIFYYEKAKTLNKGKFELLFNLGVCYGNISNFEKARENLLLAATIKEDAEVYRYIGVTYGIQNNDTKALEYFEKAYKLAPDNEQIKQNLNIARQRLGLQ